MTGELSDLRQFVVGQQQLRTLHYIPDYINAAEEQRLLQEVHASKAKWVQLSGRRLQNHGGVVHSKGLIPAPMPNWLQQLVTRLYQQLPQLFPPDQPPNHVLINSYPPGCGIMPHQDGPLYHPVVCILSLGSPAVLRFWKKQSEGGAGSGPPAASLLAMPRSLLVFQDEAYEDCLHGIQEVTREVLDSSVVNAHLARSLQQQIQLPTAAVPAAVPGCQAAADAGAADALDGCSSGSRKVERPGSPEVHGSALEQTVIPRQGERVSLTIRRVLKVHKALGLMKRS